MSLIAKIATSLAATVSIQGDTGPINQKINVGASTTLMDGTGAGKANKIFSDKRTLAASASEPLDLAGVLTDAFGTILNFTKVRAIVVSAAPGNTNEVVVGGAASNAFASMFGDATDTIKIRPGGSLALFCTDATGYAVTAGTGDLLQIANGGAGTSVTYDIAIVGE